MLGPILFEKMMFNVPIKDRHSFAMLCLERRFDAVLENRAPCCPEVLRPERHAGILEGESDVEETNGRADIEDEEDRICASSCKAGADSGQRGQDSPWALADPPS